jgi:predicted ATPase
MAELASTPALRRDQIKLQVGLTNALMHANGYAAPETKASLNRARLLIERTEELGEPPEDPLLLFSVLYGFWVANYIAFNGNALRELAAQFLALAQKARTTVPLMIGHRLMGTSAVTTGDIVEGRAHYDYAIALHDPAKHRPLATRFGQDIGIVVLSNRSVALWLLGHPEAALADAHEAIKSAREIDHPVTVIYALNHAALTLTLCGRYAAANAQADEASALADEKGASFWKADAMIHQGCVMALMGNASDGVKIIVSGITAYRLMGSTLWVPLFLAHLARTYAALGQFDKASCSIDQAMALVETTKERWCEADIHRVAGEIALMAPEPDAAKGEAYFERALAVARQQQAKSWELRAAMSMARLWRDQGKRQQAHDLLAPVYGWFTEGFDTLDLKEANALLEQLRA